MFLLSLESAPPPAPCKEASKGVAVLAPGGGGVGGNNDDSKKCGILH